MPAFRNAVAFLLFDAWFLAAAPQPVAVAVISSANPSVLGQGVTLTASVSLSTPLAPRASDATGAVTFYDGSTILGFAPLTGGLATLNIGLQGSGARAIRAYYSGDTNYAAVLSPPLPQTVNANPATGFLRPADFSSGHSTTAVVAGDFNGDGHEDLAMLDNSIFSVNIALNNGDGTFAPAQFLNCLCVPAALTVGDFNGDGKADIAVGNGSSPLGIMLSNGDGTFQVSSSPPVSGSPLAVADFNQDGKADVALVGPNGAPSILFGNGDGTFRPPVFVQATNVSLIAVADLNGDGKPDLVLRDSIMLGNGDGTFQPPLPTGTYAAFVAIADLNGDGKLDIAVIGPTNSVAVLVGNGDGTFQSPRSLPVVGNTMYIAAGDFNGDGIADVAVAYDSNVVQIFQGTSDGSLHASYGVQSSGRAILAGEFNGDGRTDLIVLGTYSFTAYFGAFFTPVVTTLTASPAPSALGQSVTLTASISPPASGSITFFDGSIVLGTSALQNGQASLTTTRLASGTRSLRAFYPGDTTHLASTSATVPQIVGVPTSPVNGLQPGTSYGAGLEPLSIASGDFNGDGIADLAVANYGGSLAGGSSVSILLGIGDGTFRSPVNFASGAGPLSLAVADLNGDGIQDLAVADYSDDSVSVLLGKGDGTFRPPVKAAAGHWPSAIAVGDFNGDGRIDIAVAGFGDGTPAQHGSVAILLGNGDGTFRAPLTYPAGSMQRSIVVADLNSDGIADLAVGGSDIDILFGQGDGTFKVAQSAAFTGTSVYAIAIEDFNGDGHPDIAAASYSNSVFSQFSRITILLNDGFAKFVSFQSFTPGLNPRFLAVGDFNSDGKPDIAVANFGSPGPGSVSLAFGNGDGTFQLPLNYPSTGNPTSLAIGDFNNDGQADLAIANQSNSISILLGKLRPATAVNLTTSVNPSRLGQGVTLIAALSPASAVGQVTFYDGTTVIGNNPVINGTASLTVSFAKAAAHSLTAYFVGSDGYAASTSAAVVETVAGTLVPVLVSLTASPNPATYGTAVTLQTSLSDPTATGRVTFFDGTTVLGSAAASAGTASLLTTALPSGNRRLTARYSGDSTFAAAMGTLLEKIQAVASNQLNPAGSYGTGHNPVAAVTADFNGDGKPDLAVANSGDGTISILLGNGDGSLQPASALNVGASPVSLATADLNGDGSIDLVVANNVDNTVSVLLGNGDGTLQPAVNYAVGYGPSGVIVADFNSDGIPDVATADSLGNTVSMLAGNGDGTFQAPVSSYAGDHPGSLVAVDSNGPGTAALAVTSAFAGTLALLGPGGNGGFVFGIPLTIGAGASPVAIVAADFNGDGRSDLALASYSGNVVVALSNIGLNLAPFKSYPAGQTPWSLAAADVDGDGIADVVVANLGSGDISLFHGNGDGTFQTAQNSNAGTAPSAVVVSDFNGDGRPDLAVVDYAGANVNIFLGKSN